MSSPSLLNQTGLKYLMREKILYAMPEDGILN